MSRFAPGDLITWATDSVPNYAATASIDDVFELVSYSGVSGIIGKMRCVRDGKEYAAYGKDMKLYEGDVDPKERIAKQKEVAKELLEVLSSYDPNVVLAGGAIRCWEAGVPATDLDIFMGGPSYMNSQQFVEFLNKQLKKPQFSLPPRANASTGEALDCPTKAVASTRVDHVSVQVISTGVDPHTVVDTFPYSHTMAYMTADGSVIHSDLYEIFLASGMIVNTRKCAKSYTDKVTKLAKENGWQITDNVLEALKTATAA